MLEDVLSEVPGLVCDNFRKKMEILEGFPKQFLKKFAQVTQNKFVD